MLYHQAPSLRTPLGKCTLLAIILASAGALSGEMHAQELTAREVHVGMGLPKPPYIMESGMAGLDYDIAKKALAAGGYKLIGQMLPQTRALAMLRAGRLDGMLSTTEGIGGQDY